MPKLVSSATGGKWRKPALPLQGLIPLLVPLLQCFLLELFETRQVKSHNDLKQHPVAQTMSSGKNSKVRTNIANRHKDGKNR